MMSRRTAHVLVVLAASVPLWAGCDEPIDLRPPIRPPVEDAVPLTPLARLPDGQRTRTALVVRLRLITLQLPVGRVSDSEEIWSYLNEEPAGARIGPSLAYNGIRVGLGAESAWPDVAKVLRRLSGEQLRRSNTIARSGSPLPVVLKRNLGKQTLFTFRRDRTLFGQDYPPGDNVLMTTVAINWEDATTVHLKCTPLVRSSERQQRYVQEPTGFVLSSGPAHYPLAGLEFGFTIPARGFLLIGPGPDVRRDSSPGYHFLTRRIRGALFETILVIAPEVFAAPIREVH